MSIKHLVVIFLLGSLFFCGIVAAETTSLTINVYDNSASHVPIKDAMVEIVNSETCLEQTRFTTVDGIAKFSSVEYKSTYNVAVIKDGFDGQTFSININSMEKEYTVFLQKTTSIQIKVLNPDKATPIAGAAISIDGLRMGTTPSSGILHVSMEKGVYHNIQVTADSYETFSSSQYIEMDQISLTITLSKSPISPRLLVYDKDHDMKPVSSATILIDGKNSGITDEYGRATIKNFTEGTYTLEITKPNYNSYKKDVTFTEASPDVIVELTYAIVPLTVFVVDGVSPVPEASIYLDNLVTGITDTTGKFTKGMEPGQTVLITASKNGYSTQSVSWSIASNQINTVTISLSQNFPTTLFGGIVIVFILIIIVAIVFRMRRKFGIHGRRGSF
ncbi:MAG TPA: PEGA domain-containing protein [Methanocorpusculum sp.]|nr:PEGA domain-containing protein [Methanocorpusculum sp.]